MRIGMDAMGGDFAPREILLGVRDGLAFLGDNDALVLYGPEEVVQAELGAISLADPRIAIVHCPQVVGMDDSPMEAIKTKRNSSIVRLAVDAGAGQLDAVISAGNTGAFAGACQLKLGVIEGISRPGIAIVMPTFHGPVLICDVGANPTPKAHHLYDYARMCLCYSKLILKVERPRVGIVSIGEEAAKGSPLVKEARALMEKDPAVHFEGNVEGRDIFGGHCDIAVCDGFVGNVILKLTEGLAEGLFKTIIHEIKVESPELVPRFEPIVDRIWKRHDFAEYGGAPLLGVGKVSIICHGRSDRKAIMNAIRVSVEQVRHDLVGALIADLKPEPQHGDAA